LTEQLLILVSEKIGELKDSVEKNCGEIERWVTDVITRSIEERSKKKERCEICRSKEDAHNLELHHIAGRKHDPRTITACKRCHDELTKNQSTWDTRWLVENQPQNVRDAFFLMGLREVLILKASKTGDSNFRILAQTFNYEIAEQLSQS
jgi:hypothetical protein